MPTSNTTEDNEKFVDKALFSKLFYNTLRHITPEDMDGVQRAYIDMDGEDAPYGIMSNELSSLSNYGVEPTIIADMDRPFQLIPRYSEDEDTDMSADAKLSVLRQMLRKIVDEV